MPRAMSRVFHGWWIVLASMLALSVGGGVYWQGFGVFFLPLAREFSTTRAALSGAVSISQLEGGLLGPIGGYLTDRYGPRSMMLAGAAIMGLGFLAMSQVRSLAAFYAVFVLVISVGMSVGIRVPALVAPSNWFVRRRGIAVGLATSGAGLGGGFGPALGWLIANVGWRRTSALAGGLVWLVCLPLAMVMRRPPEHYGLLPDGDSPSARPAAGAQGDASQPGTQAVAAVSEAQYSLMDALRTPVFWLLSLAFGLRQLVVGAIGLHLVPYWEDTGIRPELAATVLGVTAVTSVVGRLGFGWLADRLEKRFVMGSSMALVALGAFILPSVTEWWHLAAFVLIYAVGWGGGATLMFAVRADYFGRRAFGTISGMMDFVQMFGLVLGPLVAGLVFDMVGSYRPAFLTFAVSATLAASIMVFLRPPRREFDIDGPERSNG